MAFFILLTRGRILLAMKDEFGRLDFLRVDMVQMWKLLP